jgi:hypothetical protein
MVKIYTSKNMIGLNSNLLKRNLLLASLNLSNKPDFVQYLDTGRRKKGASVVHSHGDDVECQHSAISFHVSQFQLVQDHVRCFHCKKQLQFKQSGHNVQNVV